MLNGIALGTFDGLHQGHRAVIDSVIEYNRIAVTFKKPPKSVISGKEELLMTPEDKYQALLDYGVKEVFMPDFYTLKDLSPKDFLDLLLKKYNPKAIACGFNYRFGKSAAGDIDFLIRYCLEKGIKLFVSDAVKMDDEIISSSKIRDMITEGRVDEANNLIYGGFGFSAEVIHGDHRGRTIGFPTTNQIYPICLAKPKNGVYAAEVEIDGKCYKAITNLGFRPTFKTSVITAETYIPHFVGDLYGRRLGIKLLKFLRSEHKFQSVDDLKNAIEKDVSKLFDV